MGREVHQGVLTKGQGEREAGDWYHEQPSPPQTGAVCGRL